jgi:hypothetical protein
MDPSKPLTAPPPPSDLDDTAEATLAEALQAQLKLAVTIQRKLNNPATSLDPREFKDLVTAASGIVALAHRSDEALRTIETYQRFTAVVFEFLRRRGGEIGEDLVAELREVAGDLHARSALDTAERTYDRKSGGG